MDFETLRQASDRGAAFFETVLDGNGRLKNPETASDLGSVYKLPMMLILTGRGRLAHKVLNDIKERFMQPDGDFLSYPDKTGDDRKSKNQELVQYWPYMNAWVAMAAHRLCRFDISYPAWEFLKQFYNPKVGGFGTSGRYDVDPTTSTEKLALVSTGNRYDVGFFMTAHLALTALQFGDLEKAKTSGDLMVRIVEEQPALDQYFLLHVNGETGQLVPKEPEGRRKWYRMVRDDPNELFYQLGYPVYYLHHLYRLTKQEKYLRTGEKILDFAMTLHENFYTHFLNHKVAWGAGLVAMTTGKAKYREMCARCVKYLLSLQTSEGDFLRELGPQPNLDQTAEIPIWLRELANSMVDKDNL
ncbi:uncharacterized protein [Littorina saxatilis]|uniref:Uncharacterized protein n=1 Tax=Littorina saxatilis TaxID=31220 RepID=A0AAN9GL54_9CAEN